MKITLSLKKYFPLYFLLYKSQIYGNSQKYQVFHELNFVIKMVPKDHFFYNFQIMEAMLQNQAALPSSNLKWGLGILRKVIKRTSQVSEPTTHTGSIFSPASIFPTPF